MGNFTKVRTSEGEVLHLASADLGGGGSSIVWQETAATPNGDPGFFALTSTNPEDDAWLDVYMGGQSHSWTWGQGDGTAGLTSVSLGTAQYDDTYGVAIFGINAQPLDSSGNGASVHGLAQYQDAGAKVVTLELSTSIGSAVAAATLSADSVQGGSLTLQGGSAPTNPVIHIIDTTGGTTYLDVTPLGAIVGKSQTAPAAPAAGYGEIFFQTTGGKVQVAARFPTGAVQVIATEP